MTYRNLFCSLFAAAFAPVAFATVIIAPNASFETQSGNGQPFNVNILVDNWEKPQQPAYFDEGIYGFQWSQTSGVFEDTAPTATNPYSNKAGSQVAYVLGFEEAGLFQDYESVDYNDGGVPSHAFNATYDIGQSYSFTLGVFGKGLVDNFSKLQISFYYRGVSNEKIAISSTDITYTTAGFPAPGGSNPNSLIDYQVNVPAVQGSDAWAGKNIGVRIQSIQGTGQGYWDVDNVRIESVPEPTTTGLMALGCLWAAMARRRKEQ